MPPPVTHQGKRLGTLISLKKALHESESVKKVTLFFGDTVLRKVHLHLLLRVPALCFTRITQVFEGAELSLRDIENMRKFSEYAMLESVGPVGERFYQSYPTLARFKISWDEFVDPVAIDGRCRMSFLLSHLGRYHRTAPLPQCTDCRLVQGCARRAIHRFDGK